jgi:RNA polymerase sigma-70 factor (ECF subfamily)
MSEVMGGTTDEALVEAFQAGDASAFDELVQRWERRIRGAIYRIVGPTEDARDLCQETFLKAYRGLDTFKKEARFSSWLYQIALNVCRDRHRRRKGKTQVSMDSPEGASEASRPWGGPSPLQLVEGRDLSRAVSAAVASLPDEQREVVILKEYQDLTFLEIAETLDVPVSTVKTRLYRGLSLLKQRLERQGIRRAAPVPSMGP